MGILVYLLTIIHYLQTGCFEKAQSNAEKAILNLERLKWKEQEAVTSAPNKNTRLLTTYNTEYVTNSFHLMILENMIRTNVAMGNRCVAIRHIGEAFQLCDSEVRLMNSYSPQLHCLLGLYAFSMNFKEQVTIFLMK